jgi:hypothetical protein
MDGVAHIACTRSTAIRQQLPLACGLKPAMKIGASRLFSGGHLWGVPHASFLRNGESLV